MKALIPCLAALGLLCAAVSTHGASLPPGKLEPAGNCPVLGPSKSNPTENGKAITNSCSRPIALVFARCFKHLFNCEDPEATEGWYWTGGTYIAILQPPGKPLAGLPYYDTREETTRTNYYFETETVTFHPEREVAVSWIACYLNSEGMRRVSEGLEQSTSEKDAAAKWEQIAAGDPCYTFMKSLTAEAIRRNDARSDRHFNTDPAADRLNESNLYPAPDLVVKTLYPSLAKDMGKY